MKRLLLVAIAALCFSATSHAQTGVCNDGTTTNAQSKRGACAGHGGVKTWNSATAAPPPAVPTTATPTPAQKTIPIATQTSAPAAPAQSGGGGQVWVNTPTKVYHCPGDRWYGKTKLGQYMSEQQAISAGDRPDHGKSCSAR